MFNFNLKKSIALITALGVITAGSSSFAAGMRDDMAGIVSKLLNQDVSKVMELRNGGKTFGQIANEAGKLEAFKTRMISAKKAVLDKKVADGTLTREKADLILKSLTENAAKCDGTNPSNVKIGKTLGAEFGKGMNSKSIQNNGKGLKRGNGSGNCMITGISNAAK